MENTTSRCQLPSEAYKLFPNKRFMAVANRGLSTKETDCPFVACARGKDVIDI
jgi:hypothetical protein